MTPTALNVPVRDSSGSHLWSTLLEQVRGDSLRSRIIGGAFWSVVGTGMGQALGLGATVLCARLLGAAAYGQLGIVLTTVNLFATCGAVGLGVTATKHVAEYWRQEPSRAGRVIGTSFLVSAVSGASVAILLIAMAPWLARSVLKAPVETELKLGAAMIAFAAVNGYQMGALAGFEAFKTQALLAAVRGGLTLPAVVAGLLWGGLRGAVLAYTAVSAFTFLIYEIAIRKQCYLHGVPVSFRIGKDDVRTLLSFSIPVLVSSFSFTPAVWWSSALLGTNSGYAQLGIFNAAAQWQTIGLFFSNAVANVGLPTLSSVVPEKNVRKYKHILKVNFLLTTVLAMVIAIPVSVAAGWIMPLYGAGFASGAGALRLVCLATILTAANMSVGNAIWSLGAAVPGMLLALMRGVLLVCVAYLLRGYGVTGLAGAYVLMNVVQTVVQVPFMFSVLRKLASAWRACEP